MIRHTICTLLWAAAAAAADPAAAVREFYAAYASLHVSGLPDTAQMRRMAPYLSPAMTAAIKKASGEQSRCRKAHSAEKPPWVEGDLFTSNYEGFTRLTGVTVKAEKGQQVATASFEYIENGHTVKWQDEVVLVQSSGRWLIDDVRSPNGQKPLRAALSGPGCD